MRIHLRRCSLIVKTVALVGFFTISYMVVELSVSSFSSLEKDHTTKKKLERALPATKEKVEDLSRPLYIKPLPNPNALGEWGKAAHLQLNSAEKKMQEESIEKYAINIYLSEQLSLHRHIQDNRMYE
ncbi:hypothetical protein GDO78_022851 [Eleutherodactylus coqui]|nr:hypothetical protein GDO78_022851 [Eleutherodactylus coqui]